MKRVDNLLELIADPENLRLAFWKARKGKTYSRQVIAYRNNLEYNLLILREQILTGLVEVGDYHYFKIFEPKARQICASAFKEQVLHHALMNICHRYFEQVHIFDSYASRKGKGTYAALERAKLFTQKNIWFLKLDVRKFFESIHHEVLKGQLYHKFKDFKLLKIFEKIIDSYESKPNRGLPIGNLTRQYFSNHYLTGLDHYIKEELQIKAYVRYMDDMILWHNDKDFLKDAKKHIRAFVECKLRCELKPEILNRTKYGLPFLGYRTFPYRVKLLQQSKIRFIKKIQIAERKLDTGVWTQEQYKRSVLPLLAFTLHANTKEFRRKVFLKI